MRNKLVNNFNTIQYWLVGGLILFPFLPKIFESLIMGMMAMVSVVYFGIQGKYDWDTRKTKQLFLTASLFFLFLVSTLYSDNLSTALKYIKQLLPLLIIPTFFLCGKPFLNHLKLKRLLEIYILALFVLLLFSHIYFFNSLYLDKLEDYYFRISLENLIDVHGTYLTMWIGFGILLLLHRIFNYKNNRPLHIIILSILLLYFIYWLVLIHARMPLFATGMASFLLLTFKFKISFKKCLVLGLGFLIVVFLLFEKKITAKIDILRNSETALPVGKYENNYPNISSEHIRSSIYSCSYKIILSNPLLGVGIGDVDDFLQNCYDEEFYYTDVFKITKYNSHSQYLLILLSTGILGFLIFMSSFYLFIKSSISKSSYVYFCFLVFILLCFCFENILSRHDGVVFFSLFNTLLYFYKDDLVVM